MKIDICFRNQWPSRKSFPDQCLLIYDRELLKYSKAFPKWAKTFPAQLALKAGESTKSLEAFPSLLNQVLKKTINFSSREMTIIVVGGGSLTDFGGFLASVLKRGVRLILIPSTWLAAIDSAHGGKNGLNFQKYKNQIGTFYFPERIELIRELLVSQPEQRGKEAFGELLKIALISGNKLFQEIQKSTHRDGAWFYRHLAEAIKAKNKIVQMDPFEKNGIRHWGGAGFLSVRASCSP